MKTTLVKNNSVSGNKFGIIYPGDVYLSLSTRDRLDDRKPGDRRGYAISEEGNGLQFREGGVYRIAVNEAHGWTLDHTLFFDFAHNAYVKGRASIDWLVMTMGKEFGLRPEDTSKWANDIRTVLGDYIRHFDDFLEDEDRFEDEEEIGNPAALNKELTEMIFDGIILYGEIYDIAEDARAFRPGYTAAM